MRRREVDALARLMSGREFGAFAGISLTEVRALTKDGGRLAPALVGDQIDALHRAAVALAFELAISRVETCLFWDAARNQLQDDPKLAPEALRRCLGVPWASANQVILDAAILYGGEIPGAVEDRAALARFGDRLRACLRAETQNAIIALRGEFEAGKMTVARTLEELQVVSRELRPLIDEFEAGRFEGRSLGTLAEAETQATALGEIIRARFGKLIADVSARKFGGGLTVN